MFSNGLHYPTNYNEAQGEQYPAQQPPQAPAAGSSRSLQSHQINPSENSRYQSSLYSRGQYGQASPVTGVHLNYDHKSVEGTNTSIPRQAEADRNPAGSYDATHRQEAYGGRDRAEPVYDTRALGSLAYASGLTVAASTPDRSVTTSAAAYSLTAAAPSHAYRRDQASLNSVSSAGASSSFHQPALRAYESPYVNGSVQAEHSNAGRVLPSIQQRYLTSDMGNSTSKLQRTNGHSVTHESGQRLHQTGPHDDEGGSNTEQRSSVSQDYQTYRSAENTPALHPDPSSSLTPGLQRQNGTGSRQSSNVGQASPSLYGSPLVPNPTDPTGSLGHTPSSHRLDEGRDRVPLLPRAASPLQVKRYHHRRAGSSPLNQAITREQSSSGAVVSGIPGTIDPSQLYNPRHEHQEHIVAAEARGPNRDFRYTPDVLTPQAAHIARADLSHINGKPSTKPDPAPIASPIEDPRAALSATTNLPNGESSLGVTSQENEREDMELQMRMMVEKMREYQAKDPSKFAKVWEEVKKGPSSVSTPIQISLPQSSRATRLSNSSTALGSPTGQTSILSPTIAHPPPLALQGDASIHFQSQGAIEGMTPNTGMMNILGLSQAMQAVSVARRNESASTGFSSTSRVDLSPGRRPSEVNQATTGTYAQTTTPDASARESPSIKAGTVWPESKKATLASTAVKTLKSAPENAGKTIDTKTVKAMLDKNPSYLELCQILESMGFILDRTRLAKTLLAAVPDANTPSTQQNVHQVHNSDALESQLKMDPRTAQAGAKNAPDVSKSQITSLDAKTSAQKKAKGQTDNSRNPGGRRKDGTPAQPRQKSQVVKQPSCPSEPRVPSTRLTAATVSTPTEEHNQVSKTIGSGGQEGLNASSHALTPGIHSKMPREVIVDKQLSSQEPITKPLQNPGRTDTLSGNNDSQASGTAVKVSSKHRFVPNTRKAKTPDVASKAATQPASKPTPAQPKLPVMGKFPVPLPVRTMSKAEASRKRTFEEIVDLTEDISDYEKNLGRVAKSPRTEGPPVASRKDLANAKEGGANHNKVHSQETGATVSTTENGATSTSRVNRTPRQSFPNTELVRAINKEDALRRDTYDARTIARDVLIATGRHPRLRGLNEHLDVLKKNFPSVSNNADLSTFRWDLVDPGGPALDPAAVSINSSRKKRATDDNGPNKLSSKNADQGQTSKPKSSSDRIVDAESSTGASSSTKSSVVIRTPRASLTLSQKRCFRLGPVRGSAPLPDETRSSPRNLLHKQTLLASSPDRASRLSAALLELTRLSDEEELFTKSPMGSRVDVRSRRGHGRRNVGHSRLSDSFAVVINSPPSQRITSKLSNSLRTTDANPLSSHKPWKKIPLHVYKCRWGNCQAKLHNISVLRKHITKVHKPKADKGTFHCLWTGCSKIVHRNGERFNVRRKPYLSTSEEGWFEHMNKRHVEQYAWMYGDGPFSGRKLDNATDPPYFKDKLGRWTVPKPAELLSDKLPVAIARGFMPTRPWYRAHGLKTKQEKMQAIVDSVSEAHRRSDGTGQDLGISAALKESFTMEDCIRAISAYK